MKNHEIIFVIILILILTFLILAQLISEPYYLYSKYHFLMIKQNISIK